jgi:ABC-type microcin C transport system permease subunit YejB
MLADGQAREDQLRAAAKTAEDNTEDEQYRKEMERREKEGIDAEFLRDIQKRRYHDAVGRR